MLRPLVKTNEIVVNEELTHRIIKDLEKLFLDLRKLKVNAEYTRSEKEHVVTFEYSKFRNFPLGIVLLKKIYSKKKIQPLYWALELDQENSEEKSKIVLKSNVGVFVGYSGDRDHISYLYEHQDFLFEIMELKNTYLLMAETLDERCYLLLLLPRKKFWVFDHHLAVVAHFLDEKTVPLPLKTPINKDLSQIFVAFIKNYLERGIYFYRLRAVDLIITENDIVYLNPIHISFKKFERSHMLSYLIAKLLAENIITNDIIDLLLVPHVKDNPEINNKKQLLRNIVNIYSLLQQITQTKISNAG